MASQTVAAHLDRASLDRFTALVKTENRNPSQVIATALKAFLDYSPNAKRALFAIDGIADEQERAFAARVVGRSLLRAYEGILESRREKGTAFGGSNGPLDTEEAIEAEAVRLCRT